MKKLKTKIKIIVRIPINADALSTWVRGAVTSSRVISPMMVHPNSLSLRVASTKEAGGRGAMVAMDDKIISARDVIKTNTTSVETFQGANFGTMGYIFNSKVHFANTPDTPHTKDTPFDVSKLDKLPKVGIVYNYSNVPAEPLKALLDAGYEGIVTAGVGNGNIHKNLFPLLEKAAKDGVAVVRSSRVPTGSATKDAEIDDKKYGFVAGQFLNPQKARVLLQLALTNTKDPAKIQEYFDKY
ncbi:MAG: asparaginase domain-containing protein [Anaerobiospirillum succiniciproducens]|uniref:asparaginase domain-containing protein n=1 Tax=Anaerobiospirillum succiniciproducens TaxID=13335 RepID=UPI002A750537|nr:asparaginase domain-containing protein [Anaerobiospirillum succiniciproducens]MDY2798096.1 asparaginase domain-containing protein [Anaerobiospirillum succiniciproducens]